MESKGHTAYGVPRFLCEVDIKIVFSDWDSLGAPGKKTAAR